MGANWLLSSYHNYALIIGVTSYRRVADSYRQTWLTRSYVLLMNIFEILTLPYVLYKTSQFIQTVNWFPNLIIYTSYVLYSVSYVAIVYALISRGSRDKTLLEVDSIVGRLKRLKLRENRPSSTERTWNSLSYVFYLKLGAVLTLCVCGTASCLMMPRDFKMIIILYSFYFSCAMNIPLVATYRYYLALWDIAYCYQFINGKLEHLMKCVRKRYPTQVELKELHRLWSLHALLGRCTLKMNRVYGLLMLTARFDNLAYCVVNAYWGILFSFSIKTPIGFLLYGISIYSVRLLDFFLLNFMCDLTTQYESCAYHSVSEGYWFKELNAYLLYASTSKMNLWVCGLYKVNRKCWYQMLLSILNFLILLLQFHLLLRKKFTL